MSPKAPYLLLMLSITPGHPGGAAIIADVLAGLPKQLKAQPRAAPDVFTIGVKASEDRARFFDVGLYLSLKDQQHGGALHWALQLCRVDDFAEG